MKKSTIIVIVVIVLIAICNNLVISDNLGEDGCEIISLALGKSLATFYLISEVSSRYFW